MKFTKSKDGVERADVRVTFRFTAEQIDYLKRRAAASGRNGFHSAIVGAFWGVTGGMDDWADVTTEQRGGVE